MFIRKLHVVFSLMEEDQFLLIPLEFANVTAGFGVMRNIYKEEPRLKKSDCVVMMFVSSKLELI